MAALYLHHALFTTDDTPPTQATQGTGPGMTPHTRQLSSMSAITLRTATTEHSHPHEPLLNGPCTNSRGYNDLLTNQPTYVTNPRTSWIDPLSLEDPGVLSSEIASRLSNERVVRKHIPRLKLAKRILLSTIAAWAIYTTIRYFVAFTIYTSRERQIALLALGTASVLSVCLTIVSLLLSFFAPYLGWKNPTNKIYAKSQAVIGAITFLLFLGPAVVNLALTFAWRDLEGDFKSTRGRCNWDIDVAWSGTGFQCDSAHDVAWGYWLAGSFVRLLLTLLLLAGYYITSYKYLVTRRRPGRTHQHSISNEPRHAYRSAPNHDGMIAVDTASVSIPHPNRQASRSSMDNAITTPDSASGTASSDRHPFLRRTPRSRHSQKSSGEAQGLSQIGHGGSQRSSVSDTQVSSLRQMDTENQITPASSEEDLASSSETATSRYGTQIYGVSPITSFAPVLPLGHSLVNEAVPPVLPDSCRHSYPDHFRSLVDQVTRETEAGAEFVQHDVPGYYTRDMSPSPTSTVNDYPTAAPEPVDYIPVVGHIIQRMPTIDSLGSRELMSQASDSMHRGDRSVHTLSRPPTRSNTLNLHGSRPSSCTNSLDANVALMLDSSVDGANVSELGEFSTTFVSSGGSGATSPTAGSKSSGSASYFTAGTRSTLSSVDSAGKKIDTDWSSSSERLR